MRKLTNIELKSSKKQKTIVMDGKVEKSKKNQPANGIVKKQLCNVIKKSKNKNVKQSKGPLIAEENVQYKNDKKKDADTEEIAKKNLQELMDKTAELDDMKPNKKKKQLENKQQHKTTENQKDSESTGNTGPLKASPNTKKLKKQNCNQNISPNNQKNKKIAKNSANNNLVDGVTKSEGSTKQIKPKKNAKPTGEKQTADLSIKPVKEQNDAEGNNGKSINPLNEAAKIFVGNLPTNINKKKLSRIFQKFMPINSITIRTDSGKRCFSNSQRKQADSLIAYITFKDRNTAEEALSLNGTEFNGRHLRVTPGNKSALKITPDTVKKTIFVGNLKYSVNDESLRSIFSSCGEIDYVRCMKNIKGCIGVAYVRFKSADAVTLALELNGTMLDDRAIRVERYDPKKIKDSEIIYSETSSPTKEQSDVTRKLSDGSVKVNGSQPTSKKEKFKGVETKPMKHKKKKPNNQMLQLAKKIAPISKAKV